jgi:hypothetical protein
MLIKIVAFIFIIFIGSKILRKFKEKSLGFSALVIWLLVLCAVLVTAFEPHISDSVAHLMGVQRGTDVAFFLSILGLFYAIFRLYSKIDLVDKDITRLAENISIELHKKNRQE